jgi:hypothetical protein
MLPVALVAGGATARPVSPPDSLRASLDSLLYRRLLLPLNAWQLPLPGGANVAGLEENNPAALVQARLPAYGRIGVAGRLQEGSWRRPQQARRELAGGFSTDGYRRRGAWHAYGSAGYERQEATQVRWANNENPFDGNPYQWADSVGGTWQRDYLRAQLEVARTFGPHLTLGVGLTYQAGQGARESNPRPHFLSRVATIAPGVWWHKGRHVAGLSFSLTTAREQNESGQQADQFPLVYRLRGLGTFSATPIVTGERQTDCQHWQGRGQYQYAGPTGSYWLAQFAAGYRHAAVELSELRNSAQNLPVIMLLPGGTLREHTATGQLSLLRPTNWGRWLVRGHYEWLRRRGTDPLFGFVNALEDEHHVSAQVQIMPGPGGRQSFTLRLGLRAQQMQDLAASTRWDSRRGQAELTYQRRVGGQGRWSAMVEPAIGYDTQLSRAFLTARPSRFLLTIARPDFQALTEPAAYVGLGGAAEQWLPDGHALRLRLSGRYINTEALGYRITGQAGVEWLF